MKFHKPRIKVAGVTSSGSQEQVNATKRIPGTVNLLWQAIAKDSLMDRQRDLGNFKYN